MKIGSKQVNGVHLFRRRTTHRDQCADLRQHMLVFCDDHHMRYAFSPAPLTERVRRIDIIEAVGSGAPLALSVDPGVYLSDAPAESPAQAALDRQGWTKISWERAPMWVRRAVRRRLVGYKPPKREPSRRDTPVSDIQWAEPEEV